MTSDTPPSKFAFDEEYASNYDDIFAKLAPMKDALHLVTQVSMRHLPDDARILCVGAGTGAEILYLADAFPGWTFVGLDPAKPMLDRARRRIEAAGLGARCTLVEGYLEDLEPMPAFDGATAILVSHFITDRAARRGFFASIAERLAPGGVLVSADLATDASPGAQLVLRETWRSTLRYMGLTEDKIDGYFEAIADSVAILDATDLCALLSEAGLEAATCTFQSVLMRGFSARRPG